jgi:hypothetical protein
MRSCRARPRQAASNRLDIAQTPQLSRALLLPRDTIPISVPMRLRQRAIYVTSARLPPILSSLCLEQQYSIVSQVEVDEMLRFCREY